MKNIRKIDGEKGSITLYVTISMMFFLVLLMGIYVSTNSKVQKQKKELQQVQQSYGQEDANDLYQKAVEANTVNE